MGRKRILGLWGLCRCAFLMLVLASLLTLLIPVSSVKANSVVSFPDPKLEAVVRAEIGKAEGDIYESDLGRMTWLHGAGSTDSKISDLTGLEHCTSLITVFLNNNNISDISPLSGCTNVVTLYLWINNISDIEPLSGLTKLTELQLAINQISDIEPLSGLTSLNNLLLQSNDISDIEPLVNNFGLASGDTVNLESNPLDSNSINTWIPALEARGVTVSSEYASKNQPPNPPSNASPTDGATKLSLTPELTSSAFSDLDAGDSLAATQWQITATPGNFTTKKLVYDSGTVFSNLTSHSVPSEKLTYSTTYYWHVRHRDNHGSWSDWSEQTSFTTLSESDDAIPPAAVTDLAATAATSTSVTLAWTSPGDDDNSGTASTYDIRYATTAITNESWGAASQSSNEPVPGVSGSSQSFECTGLSADTTYYFAMKTEDEMQNPSGLSNVVSRKTEPGSPPAVTTSGTSGTGTVSATLNGNLSGLGAASSVQVSFEWGSTTGYGSATTPQTMTASGAFNSSLSGLTPATTYHFRAKAVGDGTAYGNDGAFTTNSAYAPVVTTGAASSVSATSGTLNGNLTSLGTASSVQVSFEWGPTTSYGNTTTAAAQTATGTFSLDVTGFAAKTTYHFRAKALGDGSAVYGDDMAFTTATLADTTAPVISAVNSSDIAVIGATIKWTTNKAATSQVEYGTTTAYGSTTTLDTNLVTTHSVRLTSLSANTTYHYRVISSDASKNEVLSADATFTTTATARSGGGMPTWAWPVIGVAAVGVVGSAACFISTRLAKK